MLYFTAESDNLVHCISAGHLINNEGFIHQKRVLGTFVLLMVLKGTLHIAQDGRNYHVHENEFIILWPDVCHYGTAPSEGTLSCYWVEFYVDRDKYECCEGKRLHHFMEVISQKGGAEKKEFYMVPEYGSIQMGSRSIPLFTYLLDLSKREQYRMTMRSNYALSALLLEISDEIRHKKVPEKEAVPQQVLEIIEYILLHYDQDLHVNQIAEKFNYTPSYLTKLFKRYEGETLILFINHKRIAIAKTLLCSSNESTASIAEKCGFHNEKYFLRKFKSMEGVTPTQFRRSMNMKKVNSQ